MFRRSITLRAFLEGDYLPSRLGMRPSSAEQIQVAVNLLDQWAGRPVRVRHLTDRLVTGFLADYLADHAPSTVNSKRRALLTVWRAAHRLGLARPPGNIPRVREPVRVRQAWRKPEVEQLVRYCLGLEGMIDGVPRRDYYSSLVITEYYTGARITALRQTRTADCNLADRLLVLRAETQKPNRDEVVALPDQAVAAIRRLYNPHRELIWPWPYCRRWWWGAFRAIVEGAGLKVDRNGLGLFHRLRRTNLSYIAREDFRMAVQQAGHSSGSMTWRYIDQRIAPRRSGGELMPPLNLNGQGICDWSI